MNRNTKNIFKVYVTGNIWSGEGAMLRLGGVWVRPSCVPVGTGRWHADAQVTPRNA